MKMLIEELQGLAADPRSWVVVALMAILAGASFYQLWRCPYVKGTYDPTDSEVIEAREASFFVGWRFALVMLGGAAITLVGLFMIAGGVRPTIALALVVAGVVAIQTEPFRLQIREQKRLVIASRDAPVGMLDGARDRLKANQTSLALTNFVLLVGLIAGLLAF